MGVFGSVLAGGDGALLGGGWDEVRTIVIDSATVLEEWSMKHAFATIPAKGGTASRAEVSDYGKG